jgi:hypothetical protein
VPAAAASLGLSEGVLSGPVATAIVAAAVVSLAACTAGVERLVGGAGERQPEQPASTDLPGLPAQP